MWLFLAARKHLFTEPLPTDYSTPQFSQAAKRLYIHFNKVDSESVKPQKDAWSVRLADSKSHPESYFVPIGSSH
jgi:hypothetical protein